MTRKECLIEYLSRRSKARATELRAIGGSSTATSRALSIKPSIDIARMLASIARINP